ncbi:uncharacterized protein LOC110984101 [Acanthaster planci]|uniref:Uncharacterized protein LOC110984101 n=1 Tax=Acanthaster planci TaxID=133434 RepID=A0A8B7Z8L7_ACAPL|nr:uncharacterized protein LOC110984101 [Acanthaster planci]
MDAGVGLFETLFFASLAVNVCSWLHFGLFAVMDKIVAPETQNRVTKLRLAHKHNAAFMRNFYLDAVLFTTLPIATIVLTFTSRTLESPFAAPCASELRILFSVVCGVFIFLLFRICLVAKNDYVKYMNIIIYVVSVATAAAVFLTGEDATIGLVLAVSTGDIFLLNLGKLMEVMRVQEERCRRIVLFLSAYTCIIFRAFLPLACISISLINGKPFQMSYPSIFFFFVGILFFGAINTWQVNVSLSRLCRRRRETVVEVPYRQFGLDGEPKPEDIAVASSSIEVPPSYTEVCGDSSYLPAFLPMSSSSSQLPNGAAPSVGTGNEFLSLDASALSDMANRQNSNSVEPSSEMSSDTAALV